MTEEQKLKELELEGKRTALELAKIESTRMDSNDVKDVKIWSSMSKWPSLAIIAIALCIATVNVSNNYVKAIEIRDRTILEQGERDAKDGINTSKQQRPFPLNHMRPESSGVTGNQVEKIEGVGTEQDDVSVTSPWTIQR